MDANIRAAHQLVKRLLENEVPVRPDLENGDEPDFVDPEDAKNNVVFDVDMTMQLMQILNDTQEFGRIESFEEAGVMTRNDGFVLHGKDGTVWQITVTQGRSR